MLFFTTGIVHLISKHETEIFQSEEYSVSTLGHSLQPTAKVAARQTRKAAIY